MCVVYDIFPLRFLFPTIGAGTSAVESVHAPAASITLYLNTASQKETCFQKNGDIAHAGGEPSVPKPFPLWLFPSVPTEGSSV